MVAVARGGAYPSGAKPYVASPGDLHLVRLGLEKGTLNHPAVVQQILKLLSSINRAVGGEEIEELPMGDILNDLHLALQADHSDMDDEDRTPEDPNKVFSMDS